MSYKDFLKTKEYRLIPTGMEPGDINPMLFEYQQDIVKWALKKGRAAIFSGCGTGKTAMQLEWARHVVNHTGGNVLILAPLAVNLQTVAEGDHFGVSVNHARKQADIQPGVNITNYEMLQHFDPAQFSGIVLIELKQSYYNQAVRNCQNTEQNKGKQVSIFDLLEDLE